MIKTTVAAALFAAALGAAAPAAAETYETPFGDVTADRDFSLSDPSYRYELGYTDPTDTLSWSGWSEGREGYGLHSGVEASVGDTTVGNHQHYGYKDNLIESRFTAGDLSANTTVSEDLIPGQQVFYNGECVWGCDE